MLIKCICFDLIVKRTHNILHSWRARIPLHHLHQCPDKCKRIIHHYLMFLWQVEFWLAKNLLLALHGSRAVYFIRHRKPIIALTYCVCCVFHLHCSRRYTYGTENQQSLSVTFFQIYTYLLCFCYNKDILINIRTFR